MVHTYEQEVEQERIHEPNRWLAPAPPRCCATLPYLLLTFWKLLDQSLVSICQL